MPHHQRRPAPFPPRRRTTAHRGRVLAVAVALTVSLALPAAAATREPHVASPNAKVAGLRLSDWLGRFYTHALPLPTAENPLVGHGNLCPVFDGVLIHYGTAGET
jgi:hypothetical protein